ncbi:MAG: autotransporter outer membrane beta-barrel domain-containing protein [Alphaproteobacteria bacterium]|nr:autotransporter outer membrane beta-barrel domain-containing protein [Alphaproteobacteria bacterium]
MFASRAFHLAAIACLLGVGQGGIAGLQPALACGDGSPNVAGCTSIPVPSTMTFGDLLTDDISQGRADAFVSSGAWIAPAWQNVPFMFSHADSSYSVRTSAFHVAAHTEYARIARLQANLPEGSESADFAALAPRARPPVDVWTTMNFNSAADQQSEWARTNIGVDYKIDGNAVIGVVAGHNEHAESEDAHFGTYFKARNHNGLSFETQAGWGNGAAIIGEQASEHDVTYVAAKLANTWTFAHYTFAPSIGVGTFVGHPDDTAGTDVASVLALEQRLARQFELGRQTRIEPFLAYKHRFEIDSSFADGAAGAGDSQSLQAGINLEAASQFSLSVTAGVEEKPDTDTREINSRLQLKVPLN